MIYATEIMASGCLVSESRFIRLGRSPCRGCSCFHEGYPVQITRNDFHGQQHESTFAVISNAARYASMFTLAPGARIDDDKFRVCVFNARSRLAWLSHAFLSITGTHTLRRSVVYQETGAAMANSNVEAPVQLDGDIVGKLPMDFEIVPRALRIYAPSLG